MNKMSVYLAGPIRGLSYDEARKWRIEAAKRFEEVGIRSFSPMRNKEQISDVDKIDHAYEDKKGYSSKDIFESHSAL